MKKIILVLTLAMMTATVVKTQSQYESGMQKAFKLWGDGKTNEAVALFERIAQAEKDNWLPVYYAANVLVATQFTVEDKTLRNSMLEKAKGIIAQGHKRSENNSELITLEGVLYTGYVAMEPETYGMQYSPMIMQLHNKAISLNPENPRALANKIEYEMGSAKFFGGDLKPYCEQMKAVIPKFENQKLDVPFAPSYGIERAREVAASCDE